ncbi:MAG: hypothetical protein JXX29_09085 [Deltaproteobacteria bacterium]|nr:hypothetical protein [Deltaproteobacteria bacterium]MBN2671816.1 hypothetical protein [Deltaproteobacteria bacterium]
MKAIVRITVITALFTSTLFCSGCATAKRDAIMQQLDAVSGATKKISRR